mgnify:FL=1
MRQIICPHQPGEPHMRIDAPQPPQGFSRVARAQAGLDIADPHPRMIHQPLRRRNAPLHTGGRATFQRIARRDQPPKAIQVEPLQGSPADLDMALMRRIKRSAQKSHGHTGTQIWKPLLHPTVDAHKSTGCQAPSPGRCLTQGSHRRGQRLYTALPVISCAIFWCTGGDISACGKQSHKWMLSDLKPQVVANPSPGVSAYCPDTFVLPNYF